MSICVACACCLPDKSDYTDPTPYKPFRIAAPEDWDTRLYSNNKELTVNAYVSNGLKIFALPNHERFDAISVKVNGQVSTVQLPSLNR